VTVYGYKGGALVQHRRTWLKHRDRGNLPLTDIIPGTPGDGFVGRTLAERIAEFIDCLEEVLEFSTRVDMLYIGATGGVRASIEEGSLSSEDVACIRRAFTDAYAARVCVVKFVVVSGGQEATWEYDAAQVIWGGKAAAMFPQGGGPHIGLFSGGGKSMQLGRTGSALSFPFSMFPKELEERQGADPDAWLDPTKWGRFEDTMVSAVVKEAALRPKFSGRYVGTAMNHRAARFTEISEQPISAAAAVRALRLSLPQFTQREGELYERMMSTAKPGSIYPLARIVAMHTFRLATVLELMFEPAAQLYFARDGADAVGNTIDCEWTVGAFMEEASLFTRGD
jgi:hypothetical protein